MRGGAAGGPVIGQHMYTPVAGAAAGVGGDRMSTPMRHQPITAAAAGVVGGYTATGAGGGGGRHEDSYTRQHSRYKYVIHTYIHTYLDLYSYYFIVLCR